MLKLLLTIIETCTFLIEFYNATLNVKKLSNYYVLQSNVSRMTSQIISPLKSLI